MPWPVRAPQNNDEVCRICNHRAGNHESWVLDVRGTVGAHCERRDYMPGTDRWNSGTQFTPHEPPRFRSSGVQFTPYEGNPLTPPTRLCEHCGLDEGAHALGTDFCPREGGGWLQDVYSYRDPSYSQDGLDSVCQVCNKRRGQHGHAVTEYQMCRPLGVPGLSTFEPYSPALRRRRNRPEVVATQPVVNGTFRIDTETRPKVLDRSLPHLSDLANAINKLAGELYRTTGRKQPLKALILERDMALSMNIEDGTEVHTATGPVLLKYDKPLAAPSAQVDPLFGVDRTAQPQRFTVPQWTPHTIDQLPLPRSTRPSLARLTRDSADTPYRWLQPRLGFGSDD